MALRDVFIAALNSEIDAEAAKSVPETGLAMAIRPANGPGDWTGGFVVRIETKEASKAEDGSTIETTRLSWTSPTIAATEKPNTKVVLDEVKAIVAEIRTRRAARG